MITKQILNRSLVLTLLIFCMAFTAVQASYKINSRARSMESSADKMFLKGKYNKAMKTYRSAEQRLLMREYPEQLNAIRLKMARLYMMLQDSQNTIEYYNAVYQVANRDLTIDDVCYFTDALRRRDYNQQAEIVLRSYAFTPPYSRDQRFLNTLWAIGNQSRYYRKGDVEYAVELHSSSSQESDYWVSNWNGQEFYAYSTSRFQDPKKIFFHQTRYSPIEDKPLMHFRSIPSSLQSGPMVYSPERNIVISTIVSYPKNDMVRGLNDAEGVFISQLVTSNVTQNLSKWSANRPLFENLDGYSYAHPALFNNGESLMFTSNRPGGFGGFDIYMCHWDGAEDRWGEPINLGNTVNTEGDEIYPYIVGDGLYFASNGHEGFGGYDIYRIGFGKNIVLRGSLYHYPYPINSTYNDYGVSFGEKKGYFISDRRGHDFKDDIYTFDMSVTPLGSESAVGVSTEYAAMSGNLNLIKGMLSKQTKTSERVVTLTPTPTSGLNLMEANSGDVVLSVYFDFNSRELDKESVEALNELLAYPELGSIHTFSITGYADDFGLPSYNKRLSLQRAQRVAEFLKVGGIKVTLDVEGRGQISLPISEYVDALPQKGAPEKILPSELKKNLINISVEDCIRINRKVRRVDITIRKK